MPRLNQTIKEYKSYQRINNGIEILTENALVRILIYSNSIFRVTLTKESEFETDFSYSIINEPEEVDYSIEERQDKFLIQTKSIELVVEKSPVRISFYTRDGRLINQDDPSFGTSWIGNEITTYKTLQSGERFIGLGEKTGNLDRRGQAYTNWTTDHFGYGVNDDPLYLVTPFFIGIHNQISYGIFLDNTHKTKFNFGASNHKFSSFGAEDGEMNYFFIHHEQLRDIIASYTWLTGRMELPPIWSLGFQISRYSYYPESRVLSIANSLRERNIPSDVIYLDIHYMDEFKVFSWDKSRFPDPASMIKKLKGLGFHVVVILDPGIKKEWEYFVYEELKEKDLLLNYPDHSEFLAEVWPGWSVFPDFTNPDTRAWWKEKIKFYTKDGIEGFWNDMNEPACWGQSIPDLVEFNYDGNKSTHKRARNIYGFQMARSTFEGAKKHLNSKRPFLLTRAGYSGIQRYAAVWTGDNTTTDEHMLAGVRLVNSMGLTGIPFAGTDVGGFIGDASPALFARWISIGAFTPFFRCHSMINSRDAEPWAFGEEIEIISREYIKLRYTLLPYLYSVFYEASISGLPVSRSMAIDYPHDQNIYDLQFQNQYFFGPSILVAPIESEKEYVKIYLPDGKWYNLYSDQVFNGKQEMIMYGGLKELPLLVKESAIIPVKKPLSNAEQTLKSKILQIHFYYGNETNEFLLYEDDGSTYAYQRDHYYARKIIFDPHERKIIFEKPSGEFVSPNETYQLFFHGFKTDKLFFNNDEIEFKEILYSYTGDLIIRSPLILKSFQLNNLDEKMEIRF